MATFELYEDLKVSNWRRTYFTVEAESLEEAINLIKDGTAECEYSELLDCEEKISPCMPGEIICEIYEKDNDLNPVYTDEFQI